MEDFRAHYADLVRLAVRVLGDRGEAEEVAADAFLRLRGNRVAERPEDERLAWLRRVTVNAALNRLRSRRRAVDRVDRAGRLDAPLADDGLSPAAAALRTETRERVRAVLAAIPERQAACLLLTHDGVTHAEIAAALGIARGSVGVLLARGERAFRERWDDDEERP